MVKAKNVSHIIYPTSDREKSIDFFTGALGFYRNQRGTTTYLGAGDTLLELSNAAAPPADPERPTAYMFGVEVDNLEEAIKAVQAHGGEIVREIWQARTFWGRQAVVQDPGGQRIALREYRAPDNAHFERWKPEE